MSNSTIATRYAKSLLDLAIERGSLDKTLEDIKLFNQVADNRDFYLLLKSPIVNQGKKIAIFREIFEGKVDELTIGFLNILAKKGRENLLPEIADAFIAQYQKLRKISTVKLTTASTLTESQLATIEAKLKESNATQENINIETSVDPSLIGGLVIQIGDQMYDASVAHKLNSLKKEFIENKYVKSF